MADGKVNLPDDLFSSRIAEGHSSLKVEASGGDGGQKGTVLIPDYSKDQVPSDSSIPLSPQWLYSKPIETKTSANNSMGANSTDPILKDSWRMDGSQDKKDWRRTATDVDTSRRWREEERETSLLGRRDRRKEDRRPEVTSTSENRALPSSDRWHDGRGLGHDSRRENKWSSRWGPEEKEKDSRSDKRSDAEKEDAQVEKQASGVSSRLGSERDTDSRDKWRPRHRMEAQATGVATYRAAPGFGLEKARIEGSNVRFSPGRGRANFNANQQIGKPFLGSNLVSAPLDNSKAVLGKSCLPVNSYCYPRGKLLDIYRRRKLDPAFKTMPSGIEDCSPITQPGFDEPLAFVAPNAEEKAVLSDIWGGKISNSEVSSYFLGEKGGGSNNDISGADLAKGKQTLSTGLRGIVDSGGNVLSDSDAILIAAASNADGPLKDIVDGVVPIREGKKKDMLSHGVPDKDENYASSYQVGSVHSNYVAEPETYDSQRVLASAFQTQANGDAFKSSAASEISSDLPDDSGNLFDFSPLHQTPSIIQQDLKMNEKLHLLESVVAPEDLSLCYLDPQGVVQGPFLGIDIISWFEQGFFSTDLPVRRSDAPEGSPFQELGHIMPHLRAKSGSVTGSDLTTQSEVSDATGRNLKANVHSLDYDGSIIIDDQTWASSQPETTSSAGFRSQIPDQSYPSKFSGDQSFNSFVTQDGDIALSKMARSSSCNPLMRPSEITSSYNSLSHQPIANEVSRSDMHEADKLHPFGLLMSELRDASHLRRAQSYNTSSRIGDQGHFLDSLIDRDAPFGGMVGQPSNRETWSDDHGLNRHFNHDQFVGSLDERYLSHMGQKYNNFDVPENLLLQNLQEERLQQQASLSNHFPEHLTGSNLERFSSFSHSQNNNSGIQQMIHNSGSDLEQLMGLRRQLEFQQQQEMHHQQLLQQMELQQQQESQAKQLYLEQLRHPPIPDSNLGQSKLDLARENLFDQLQMRKHMLHDSQQNSYSRHLDPSMEQIIQANMAHAVQGRQADFSDLLMQSRHGNILPSEQQLHLQQEQVRAQQLAFALGQQLGLEGEGHFGRSWAMNETAQLLRNPATHQLTHTAGYNASDFPKQQQRFLPQEEQLSYLGRNLAEQKQRGFYDPISMFERSTAASAGALAMNFDSVGNSVQGRELQEQNRYMRIPSHLGSLASHHLQASDELFAHNTDAFKGFSVNNGDLENNWTDPRMELQHVEGGRHRREFGVTVPSADLDVSASSGTHEQIPAQGLADLIHQKLGLRSTQQSHVDKWHPLSSRNHDQSWQVPGANSLIQPFDLPQDQQHLDDSFIDGSPSSNPNAVMQDHFKSMKMAEQYSNLGTNERMPFWSRSGSLVEEPSLFSANRDTLNPVYGNPLLINKSAMDNDLLESETNKGQRHEFLSSMSKSLSGVSDFSERIEGTMHPMELPVIAHSRRSSLSSAGGDGGSYGRELVLNNSHGDESSSDRTLPTKGFDNAIYKRTPVSRVLSSPDVQSDQPSGINANQNSVINLIASDGRREPSGNPSISNLTDAQASGKKEVRFRRASSCSEGSASETSFIDMLKKPVFPEADAAGGVGAESFDGGTQAGRSGKKKGKKGKKQLDPSLLGFVVSSNRIMMGEIQRPED
ncbi:uncharacterized protein LOC114741297 isoform X1 [Neltuma alba]|uniref:uncharacterized protein LOC114741297 isoform X1 n=1 Tax=Neltuma alba TaxID=207710 RepID=UPI0010A4858E|nr:uncharacterized protein LOC114741297 isoform X1 [Prosopis alba]